MKPNHFFIVAATLLMAGLSISQEADADRNLLLTPDDPVWAEQAPDQFDVKFETSEGPFTVRVYREWSPRGADRFYNLARLGFYDDQRFFRKVDGFVVQWGMHGNPKVTRVWKQNSIEDDEVKKSNTRGRITFAASSAPDSRTTQVFINLGDNDALDSMGFAPFGEVIEGMDVVESLNGIYREQPTGRQREIAMLGNAYLDQKFPELSVLESSSVVESVEE
jgi:peptidyl-prolyl cis-trans isomerase A (cyclophilin A)